MEEQIEKKSFVKRKVMGIPVVLLMVLGIGMVLAAGYIVNSLFLTVGVGEAFEVQYAVMGDSGNYVTGDCANATVWFISNSTSIPTGNFYPMESRKVCVKIHNLGQADIPYTITSTVTNDNTAGDCVKAFGNHNIAGNATALTDTYEGVIVQIAANATPVSGCIVRIDVARGS